MTGLFRIQHLTRYDYDAPVSESIMEVKLQPRADGRQRLQAFDLTVRPHCQVFYATDYSGNAVHSFNIPGEHGTLEILARSLVEVEPIAPLPDALSGDSWQAYDQLIANPDIWEMIHPSRFTQHTERSRAYADRLAIDPKAQDPLTTVKRLNVAIYKDFDYESALTNADSPIDQALELGKGVCQDFAHIMLTILRGWGMPARYVSGYMLPGTAAGTERSVPDASHAWVEVLLPEIGWLGLDPTNDILATNAHVRVALGRDYADVPPTRGVLKGSAGSDLTVEVRVESAQDGVRPDEFMRSAQPVRQRSESKLVPSQAEAEAEEIFQQQQQQQQQQQ